MPFFGQMCAEVGDNSYSKPAYLQANRSKENLVTIVRVRSNRTFYLQLHAARPSGSQGHSTYPARRTWVAPGSSGLPATLGGTQGSAQFAPSLGTLFAEDKRPAPLTGDGAA